MQVSLGTLDVVMEVISEGVDTVDGLRASGLVLEMAREQYWRCGMCERERESVTATVCLMEVLLSGGSKQ